MFSKNILLLLILTVFQLFSQKNNTIEKTDSTTFYINKSNFYNKNNNFELAIENANKAIFYSEKNKSQLQLQVSYTNISNLLIENKKYNIAIEKLLRLVSLLYLNETNPKLGNTYFNLGICYFKTNKINQADDYFNRALDVYKILNLKIAEKSVLIEKSKLYFEINDLEKAKIHLKAITILPNENYNANLKAESYFLLGKIFEKENKINQSIENFEMAKKFSQLALNFTIQKKSTLILSKIYNQNKNFELANINLNQYINIINKIELQNNQKLISNTTEKNTVLQFSKKNEILEKARINQERTNKFLKLINILSIALITILSLLSISLYKNNLIRNNSNILLKQKNTELLEAKNSIEKVSMARSEFLSTVSHELRTPLNAINGISHILLEDNPNENQIEYLKSLKFSGKYLLTFINEILEINRIESNNLEVEKVSFNIRELLLNIQNSLKEEAIINNNKLVLTIDYEVPEYIEGDLTKLSQIFINLINNAIKFTKNGTINLNVNLKSINSKNCELNFEVQDTGIGIPKDKQNVIFDSFEQGSIEINRKYGGTGLGLTIVKKLVEYLGGTIKLISEINKGSRFKFDLKFKIGSEKLLNNQFEKNGIEIILANKKILLVEDNKINQMITKKIVEKMKIDCQICETGEDAIDLIKNNNYDLVLMDVHLPGINGTIATQEIRKFNNYTPIIALTAISLYENREMLMSFGMTDVVTKPFDPDNLYLKMAEVLSV